MVDIRWVWIFLDTVREDADQSWQFWQSVTESAISPRRGDHSEFATLLPPAGDAWVKLQAVQAGGGLHLDLDVADVRAAADEAKRLGATELGGLGDPSSVIILSSPGGQVFCFTTDTGHGKAAENAGRTAVLDQVCLDLPEDSYAVDVVFWHELTGWPVTNSARREFSRLSPPDGIPVRVLLQRLGDPNGPSHAHVDFACADRAETEASHRAAGATVVQRHAHWTVMRDPLGRAYCLTDRSPLTGRLPE